MPTLRCCRADWTQHDEAIGDTLAELGRSGVPAYVLYVPGESSPRLLPEVLTPGIVMDAIGKLPRAAAQSTARTAGRSSYFILALFVLFSSGKSRPRATADPSTSLRMTAAGSIGGAKQTASTVAHDPPRFADLMRRISSMR